jgi:hypothetical protein
MYVDVRPKHNSTMVSDASPGTADPKMNKSFVHTAHISSDCACAQDGHCTTMREKSDSGVNVELKKKLTLLENYECLV